MKTEITFCKGCGRQVRWYRIPGGKTAPFEVTEKLLFSPKANDWVAGYESHFASCPCADNFRKPKDGISADK